MKIWIKFYSDIILSFDLYGGFETAEMEEVFSYSILVRYFTSASSNTSRKKYFPTSPALKKVLEQTYEHIRMSYQK